MIEPKQRAHSSLLAAGLASELKIDAIPYGRRFPVACCGELQTRTGYPEPGRVLENGKSGKGDHYA